MGRKMHRMKRKTNGEQNILLRSCGDYDWAKLHLPRPEERVLEGPCGEKQISVTLL